MSKSLLQSPPAREDSLQSLLALIQGCYWEQDCKHRFTRLRFPRDRAVEQDLQCLIGKAIWELELTPLADGGCWDQHLATRGARLPFEDFLVSRPDPVAGTRYFSLAGRPRFDAQGAFLGYQGLSREVTPELRQQQMLQLERDIIAILLDAGNADQALGLALRALCLAQGWESGIFWRLDPGEGLLFHHAGWCVDKPAAQALHREARGLSIRRGQGLAGRVWLKGASEWLGRISDCAYPLAQDLPTRAGWEGALSSPVMAGDQLVGVLEFHAPRIPSPHNQLLQLLQVVGCLIGNFSARLADLARLGESEERYQSTVELAAIGIGHVALDGRFIHVNQKLCQMLGYSREELLGKTVSEISHPEDRQLTAEGALSLRQGKTDSFSVEKRYLRKDGSEIWVRLSIAQKRDAHGAPLYDISVVEDISARKEAEEKVRYLATHDALTGLPNRSLFSQLLGQAIRTAQRYGNGLAVLFIDMDNFKLVNDSLGHEAGDHLLRLMAERFRRCLRGSDLVARLGGDEFVVLLPNIDKPGEAAQAAGHLLEAAREAAPLPGRACEVTLSIGVALYPGDGEDETQLMRKADLAMYAAKEAGRNAFRFYKPPAAAPESP